jgi:hypothetical protein
MISQVLQRQISINAEELRNELDKCEIICRNCHNIEHVNTNLFNALKNDILRRSEIHKEQREPVDRIEVKNMFNQGVKSTEIAKRLGCAKSTISGILNKDAEEVGSSG